MKLSDAIRPTAMNAAGKALDYERVFTLEEAEKIDAIQNVISGSTIKEAQSLLQRLIQALNDNVIVSECGASIASADK